jgi:radical SAM protein with 4Fe4S-binding SPASM domain
VAAYRREGRPFSVHLDPTHRCDLRCAHCYLEEREPDGLDTAAWRAVLRDLAELRVFQLVVGGGEPLLRADLFELLATARELRFATILKTHGGRVDAPTARELRRLAVRRVDVSLYALDPAVHETVTRQPGSHARTLAGIEHLAAAGLPVRLSCPVMATNAAAAPAVRDWAAARGFGFLASPGLYDGNRGERLNERLGPGPAGLAAFAALEEAAADGPPRDPTALPDPAAPLCGAALVGAYVGPAGDVRPCSMWPTVAGDVRVTPFSALWRGSPLFAAVRAVVHGARTGCAGCATRWACTPCPARSVTTSGAPLPPDPFDCALAAARAARAAPARGLR